MASYTRQSTFADGDLITAALFNNEYNQLVSAFDNATGHKHDGTIGEGPVISVLGDAGLDTPLNKILIDTINDHIEFYIDVSETSTQQLYIADGAIVPTTDNDIDLGTNALQFKDLYLNGTANIDSLVADTIDINGGTIDGVTIGGTSAGAITGTTITGTSFVIGSATITETELEILDGATLSTTELNYVDGVTSNIQTQIDTKAPLSSPNLTGIPTAPTASANTNTTQVATTAYVQTEITDLIGAAPGTLDTLNELAAAINNDANYNTTLTTALATKLPLAGGTMTGNVTYGDNVKANFGTSEDLQIYHDGSNSYITDVGTGNLIITGNLTGNVTGNVTGTVSDISNHSTSDLSEGTNLYYTDARFDTRLATKDTDDVSEGTSNLYYTDARVQNVSINNVVEDTTPQLGGSLDLNSNNITGTGNIDVTGTVTSDGLTVVGVAKVLGTAANTIVIADATETNGYQLKANTSASVDYGFVIEDLAGKDLLKIESNGDISFYEDTGTSAALFWDASTERLGLGTTSPTTTLDVNGTIKYGSLSDGTITITGFADEDNMASNSATLLPTQQSVKAYVDSQVSSAGGNGISFADNEKAQFGDGNDLQIYHDGIHSYIKEAGTGNLNILANDLRIRNAAGNEDMLQVNQDGDVKISYDGSTKLATTNTGIDVTGTVTADGLTVDGTIDVNTTSITGIAIDSTNNGSQISFESIVSSVPWNVGISGDTTEDFVVYQSGSGSGGIKLYTDGDTRFGIANNGDISFYEDTGTTAKFFWDASTERLGMGTTSPDTALHAVGVGSTYIKAERTSSGSEGHILLGAATSQNQIISRDATTGNKDLTFTIGTSERMRIDSSGRVGIGTSSPDTLLNIASASAPTIRIENTDTSLTEDQVVGALEFFSNDPSGKGPNVTGYIETRAADAVGAGGEMVFATGATGATPEGERAIERMRITSSGNVGIGTSSPDTLIHASANTGATLTLESTDIAIATNEVIGAIDFYSNDASGIGAASRGSISLVAEDAAGAGSILFKTSNASTASSEKVRITSSGNVGIGTDSPSLSYGGKGLQIENNDTAGINLHDTTGAELDISVRSGDVLIYERDGFPIRFGTAGSERMRIDSSGNVGIGTSSPDTLLEVVGADPILTIRDTETTGALANTTLRLAESSGGDILGNYWDINLTGGTTLAFKSSVVGVVNERMRIDSSGNVGIGTTSPNADLHLRSVLPDIRLEDSDDGSEARISYNTAGNNGLIISSDEGNEVANSVIAFKVDASEKARIDSSGRLLINKTSATGSLSLESQAPSGFSVGSGFYSASTQSTIEFKDTNTTANYKVRIGSETDDLVMFAGGSKRMTIDSSGNVGIGTTSPSRPLHIAKSSGSTILELQRTDTNTTGATGVIQFNASDDHAIAAISVFGDGDNEGGEITFRTTSAASDNNYFNSTTERMRIDSSGRVGIGTTSPQTSLSIETSGTQDVVSPIVTGQSFGVTYGGLYTVRDGVGDQRGLDLKVYTANVGLNTAMRINSSGNVGIGTSSPDTLLNLAGDETAVIRLENSNGSASDGDVIGALQFYKADSSGAGAGVVGQMKMLTQGVGSGGHLTLSTGDTNGNDTERLRISSNGNVGIGTTSPNAKLSIHAAVNNPAIEIVPTTDENSADSAVLRLWGTKFGTANRYSEIRNVTDGSTANNELAFNTNGSERMRIDSSGNVGIGTTSPATDLHVSSASPVITATATNTASGLRLNVVGGSGALLRIQGEGTEKMRLDGNGNLLVGTTAQYGQGLSLNANATAYFRKSSDAPLTLRRDTTDGAILNLYKDTTPVGSIATTSGAINLYGGSGTNGITVDSSGNLTATANVTAYSDERLKDNIQTLQGSKVLEMRGVSFTKDGEASSGVIAQEIEKVAPELVHTAKDEMGTKSVAYGNLVGYLIEAIKDQQQQIDELKARLDNDSSK